MSAPARALQPPAIPDMVSRLPEVAAPALAPGDAVPQMFRLAMRELTSGVSVVTTGADDKRTGLTATSVTSLSMTPPSLLVCIQRTSSSLEALQRNGVFAINLLRADDREVAEHFAGRTNLRGAARFESRRWRNGALNTPILISALTSIECTIARTVEWHTHCILFGEVQSIALGDSGKALLYRHGAYAMDALPSEAES